MLQGEVQMIFKGEQVSERLPSGFIEASFFTFSIGVVHFRVDSAIRDWFVLF